MGPRSDNRGYGPDRLAGDLAHSPPADSPSSSSRQGPVAEEQWRAGLEIEHFNVALILPDGHTSQSWAVWSAMGLQNGS